MIIYLGKFGEMLVSRPAGKEAYLSAKAYIFEKNLKKIVFDFEGVKVLTPSWMSEFVNMLKADYPNVEVEYMNSTNPSVSSSLKFVR